MNSISSAACSTRTWEWPSALSASILQIIPSLTNAQRSAVQAAPSSVVWNGSKELRMIKKMTIVMKVKVMKRMRMKMMALMYLCGEKQHQASLKANAPQLAVQNAV